MTTLFDRHRELLTSALEAVHSRRFWSPYPEVPSGRFYGETARADGEAGFAALRDSSFDLPGHP